MADEIEITAYDPRWPALFRIEAARLHQALPSDLVRDFEHIGSTAVPSLAAKPIIDMVLQVSDFSRARELVPLLEALDYVFWRDDPDRSHLFFVRGMPPYGARRTHHLHIYEHPETIADHLDFRDALRRDPAEAARYAALKHRLAVLHRSDREAYTQAKADYIDAVRRRLRSA